MVCFNKNKVQNWENFQFPQPIELTRKIIDIISPEKQDDSYYYTSENCFIYNDLLALNVKENTFYQRRRRGIRENKKNLCPTLTANMGTGGHNVPIIKDNYGIRKLTPQECFMFQGFTNIKLPKIANSHLYKQAGNSVTVPLICRIFEQIKKVL